MPLLTTEEAVIRTLSGAREYGHEPLSTYQLAAGMNMVASTLRPTLDVLAASGHIQMVDKGAVPAGVEFTPGDSRWAITHNDQQGRS